MPEKIDLVIVKPGSPQKIYGDLSSSFSAIEPPVWGGMVASFIRGRGYSVKMLDMEIEGQTADQIVKEDKSSLTPFAAARVADKIIKSNPLLVNIVVMGPNPSASSTPLMTVTGELLNLLKEKNPQIKTILTGIHPSALPERTLKEEKTDFIGQGESFYTILELLKVLKSGKKVQNYQIKGLWYIDNGEIISNGWGELIQNPNELPQVSWDLIPIEKYRAHNWHCFGHLKQRSPYAAIYTSLGCPYNCSYCNIRTFYNGRPGIRFRSLENVVGEIDLLVKNYGVKNIKFLDELFAIDEERVASLCNLIIERGYNLNIWAYARINTVKEAMLKKMKKAGINWLCYGIEAGSQDVRTGVDKLGFDQDQIKKVIKMTKDAGIYVLGNFIFGLPDDNPQTMQETLDLAKELNCEYVNFYANMAYPGSRLYEEALERRMELPKSWLGYAQLNEETSPLGTKYISGREVLRFRDKAFREYYTNPEYLKMIEEEFGQEAISHIKEMLKYEIKRKFA